MRIRLRDVPVGEFFMLENDDVYVHEYLGNGWSQVKGSSKDPWQDPPVRHMDPATWVCVDDPLPPPPSQTLSCFL